MPKEITLPYRFQPRWYQLPILQALDQGCKKVVACHHRGAGKDLMCLNYLIKKAIEVPGVYLHCFPNYSQGKRAIWKSVHNNDDGTSMSYLDHIPPEIIKSKNSSEMMIEFINGSIYCVMGVDGKNAQRARGMNPTFVIMSEYAYMDPESWNTIEPRVSQNKGTVIFISTPNGQNHFYSLYNVARGNPDKYFASLLTIEDTKTIPMDHLDQLRAQGIPEDFIQQEYLCSFTRGAEGSYYGKLIQSARDGNRIIEMPVIPDLPCHTCWDIGMSDYTSIWIFQALRNNTYNFLQFYENSGTGLEHYINYLNEWKQKRGVQWGKHFVPHDMANREFTSGVDRVQSARAFGYEMSVVPKKAIYEGIQAVRSTLPLCFFHAKDCAEGIRCLDFYRKKWNESLKVYFDEPLHDRWSHGADAFRYGCTGIRAIGFEEGNPEDDYKALRGYFGG